MKGSSAQSPLRTLFKMGWPHLRRSRRYRRDTAIRSSSRARQQATHQAERTQQSWNQVTTVFEKAKMPQILKEDLSRLLRYFRDEANSWTAEIKWRQLRYQAAMVNLHEEIISKLLVADDAGRDGEKEEANRASKTTLADFRTSFQEVNQTVANQFSKEIPKLILDMAAGKEVK